MSGRPQALRAVGAAIYGYEWQARLSEALGPWHPLGPRERIDPRMMRRWIAGERAVPDWVGAALRRIVLAEIDKNWGSPNADNRK